MKKMSFALLLGIAVAAAAAVSPIKWKSTTMKIGEIKVGETVPVSFEFTNTGEEAITILEAKGSCGCTSVTFPEESIAPGATAEISAKYKSSKPGAFQKSVKIMTSESKEPTYLYFSGMAVE